MKQVVIGGGGLAGLTCAFLLNKAGFEVKVIERKAYPFHRVCGEYISNEVVPFLNHYGLYPSEFKPAQLIRFKLTSVSGKSLEMPLDLGGFGVSRYVLDDFLAQKCRQTGIEIIEKTQIKSVEFKNGSFEIWLSGGSMLKTPLYIAAHGKTSVLDKNRTTWLQPAQYVGVKYHLKADLDSDLIALHNFEGGYCGISKVEGQTFNLCYLTSQTQVKRFGGIENMEKELLHQNPHLKSIWQNSDFVFKAPMVISGFSFLPKKPVENNILMVGDAAGLITPLCGNGMALAFRSGQLAAQLIAKHHENFELLKSVYSQQWRKNFAARLWIGRNLQALFGRKWHSEFAVKIPKPVALKLMSLTHGQPDMI